MAQKIVVIAGFSCAGKTKLIRLLHSDEGSELRSLLQLDDFDLMHKNQFPGVKQLPHYLTSTMNLCIHYDLLKSSSHDINFGNLNEILSSCQNITIVNICCSRSELQKRLQHRIKTVQQRVERGELGIKHLTFQQEKLTLYETLDFAKQYLDWFNFLGHLKINHNYLAKPSVDFTNWQLFTYDKKHAIELASRDFSSDTVDT